LGSQQICNHEADFFLPGQTSVGQGRFAKKMDQIRTAGAIPPRQHLHLRAAANQGRFGLFDLNLGPPVRQRKGHMTIKGDFHLA